MAIETSSNILAFLDIEAQYFEITAGNDALIFTSSSGGPVTLDIPDGTYSGLTLAAALQTAMNANATLTGGIITFAVSYSTTTNLFTIDSGVGRTIAFTITGSDAGFTFGFTENATAVRSITSDTASGDTSSLVEEILVETEKFISNYCRRTFESTSYSLEKYSGKGYSAINLNQYPVTAVDRVCIGTRNAITMTNTTAGTSASVSVLSNGLRLVLNGTADASITFDVYTTISTLIAAVNALGSGWSASITNSDYSSFNSTDLIQQYASGCINSQYVYLSIPDYSENNVEVDLDRGQIKANNSFPNGFQNIFVDYTAGYSAADMPSDLKLAVKMLVQYIYEKAQNNLFGVDFYNIGASGATGLRTVFEKAPLPKEVKLILSHYKRYSV